MTKRRPLGRLQRVRIFDDAHGICCLCKIEIQAGRGEKWIVEHKMPLWLGGSDDEANMGPAHERCAIRKTCAEATVKAKSDAVRANYLGIKTKPKGRPFPCRKDSPWKKRIDGTVVRRALQMPVTEGGE